MTYIISNSSTFLPEIPLGAVNGYIHPLNPSDPRNYIHTQIRFDRDASAKNIWTKDLNIYRKYVAGHQTTTLTVKQKDILQNLLANKYCDNICAVIVGEGAARLQFRKWTTANEIVQKALDDIYLKCSVQFVSGQCHYDMLRDGNTCISIAWDSKKKRVKMYREDWWDGLTGIWVKYDYEDPNEILYAVKEWALVYEGSIRVWRRVTWVRGEMQRWISTDRVSWLPYSLPEDKGAWPILLLDKNSEDLPIPIVHFPNGANIHDQYGLSELAGGFIGAQDQINDLQYVISSASRLTGYQMYTIAGVKKEKDPLTGEEKSPEVGPGQVWTSTSKDTHYGTLPSGDITQLIAAYEHKIKSIARNARVPLHRLGSGNPPSGEALVRAEAPAVGKAEKQVEAAVVRWRVVAETCLALMASEGSSILPESAGVEITAVMEEPDRRDKLGKSQLIMNLVGYLSPQEALRIMEYSESDAEKIVAELITFMTKTTAASTPLEPKVPSGGSVGHNDPNTSGNNTNDNRGQDNRTK